MKTSILRSLTVLTVACLTVFLTCNSFAGPKRVVQTPSGAAGLLVDAYAALERADHDYHGKRIEAMKQIEAAGKIVGANVHGDGHVREKQGISDEQLRTAEGLLQQAKGELRGKALKHVEKALNHLNTALRIK